MTSDAQSRRYGIELDPSPRFGVISDTAVSPPIIQFAPKLNLWQKSRWTFVYRLCKLGVVLFRVWRV